MIEPNWPALVLFCVTFGSCCFAFFAIIGMLPLRARPSRLSGVVDVALIFANLLLLILLTLGIFLFAFDALRWTSVIVAGGLIFLFIPSLFQIVPPDWRETRGGMVGLAILQIVSLAIVLKPAGFLTAIT